MHFNKLYLCISYKNVNIMKEFEFQEIFLWHEQLVNCNSIAISSNFKSVSKVIKHIPNKTCETFSLVKYQRHERV